MTNSYPDRQDHSRSNVSCVYKGHDTFAQSIWGNQVKIQRISQIPNSQRYTSQEDFKLLPRSIWGNQVKIRKIFQKPSIQRHSSRVGSNYFPINLGQSSQDS